jgi:hypothetical protein
LVFIIPPKFCKLRIKLYKISFRRPSAKFDLSASGFSAP